MRCGVLPDRAVANTHTRDLCADVFHTHGGRLLQPTQTTGDQGPGTSAAEAYSCACDGDHTASRTKAGPGRPGLVWLLRCVHAASSDMIAPNHRRQLTMITQDATPPRSTEKLLADLERNFELVGTVERLTLENATARETIRALQAKVTIYTAPSGLPLDLSCRLRVQMHACRGCAARLSIAGGSGPGFVAPCSWSVRRRRRTS